ncbi:MAG: Bug family tripartite tricarboxylate transporter substrate binding protein [Burkholderiales bacterium]|jgi:tripartite-type tricarboxylate transporter receptor subunit TctC
MSKLQMRLSSGNRRALLSASGAAVLVHAAAGPARAQTPYPSRPIRLIVPFPPGGLIDQMARLMGPRLARELGQPVVIDNKPGAGGNLGAAEAARAPADGYTLLMASPPLTISPALYPKLPYRPEQIVPVGIVGRVPNVLLVSNKSPLRSVDDLLRAARQAPGKLNYASNGNGTSLHLSAELLKASSGTFIVHIPYRGAAAAVTGLIGGEVDFMFENLPSVLGQIQGGSVRALAVTTATRSKALPQVPTLIESGVSEFDVSAWYGMAAPAGVPAPALERIGKALEAVARQGDLVNEMESKGATVGWLDAAAATRFMSADAARWKRVTERAGIRLES